MYIHMSVYAKTCVRHERTWLEHANMNQHIIFEMHIYISYIHMHTHARTHTHTHTQVAMHK